MKVHFPLNHVHVSNSNRKVQNQVYKVCTLNNFLLDEFVGIIFFFSKKSFITSIYYNFFLLQNNLCKFTTHTHANSKGYLYSKTGLISDVCTYTNQGQLWYGEFNLYAFMAKTLKKKYVLTCRVFIS